MKGREIGVFNVEGSFFALLNYCPHLYQVPGYLPVNDYTAAAKAGDYNKAIELDANYAVAYLGRGIVYRQQGQTLIGYRRDYEPKVLPQECTHALFDFSLPVRIEPFGQLILRCFRSQVELPDRQVGIPIPGEQRQQESRPGGVFAAA